MFRNYFKVAIRYLLKYYSSSLMNILGLAIGISSCLIILLYVQYELSYDKFQENSDNLYRIVWSNNNSAFNVGTPTALAPEITEKFGEVKNITRISGFGESITYQGHQFQEKGIIAADKNIFNMFSFDILKGSGSNPLDEPNTIIINEELAKKYFGKNDPINNILEIKGKLLKITAIFKNLPSNSSILPRAIVSGANSDLLTKMDNHWGNNLVETYILTTSNFNKNVLENKINKHVKKYMDKWGNHKALYRLQPYLRIHLYSKNDFGIANQGGDYHVIILCSAIALFIMLIASINFVNVSIGQIISRFKEIGIRKVLGAKKRQIIFQFWSELVILVFISLCIGITLVTIMIPEFNSLMSCNIILQTNSYNAQNILAVFVSTCLLVGFFPTFFFAKINIVDILKKETYFGGSNRFSKILLLVQFSISIFFIACTTVYTNQIDYMMSLHKIPEKERIIEVNLRLYNNMNSNDHKTSKDILAFYNVTKNHNVFLSSTVGVSSIMVSQIEFENKKFYGGFISRPSGYFDTFGIKIVKGRDFSPTDFPNDTISSAIVNLAFCQAHKVSDPIGKIINDGSREYTIIGVTENTPFRDLRNDISPSIFNSRTSLTGIFYFRINKEDQVKAISYLSTKWKEFFPKKSFIYSFYDETWKKEYLKEINLRDILGYTSLITLLISCLGIFGLTSLSIARRTKEIGIRKVLGASITKIVLMLTKEFILLIVLSAVLAIPFIYSYMNNWLQQFVYHINVEWTIIVLSMAIAIIVSLLTISYKTVRAARVNPVESIKYE